MFRRFVVGLITALSLVAVTAAPAGVQAKPARGLTTLRIGYIPIGDFLPMYVAQAKGYFAHEGLAVKFIPFAGGATIIPALQGGSLDLGISNGLSVLLAASHGVKVVCVTAGNYETRNHPTHALLVMDNSKIHSAKDLNGKRVAVNTLNNIVHVITEQWMADHGGKPSTVSFSEIDFPTMLAPLTHHQIDAAYEVEPFITIGKSMGARVLTYPMADEAQTTLVAPIVGIRPWVMTHQKEVAGFVRAFNKGITFINSHNAEARTILTRYTKVSAPLSRQIALPEWKKHLKPSALRYWVQLGVRWHLLSKAIPVGNLIWNTAR